MLYDSVLLVAVLMLATALYMMVTRSVHIPAANAPFTVYVWLVVYIYFAWQWSRGQTLGMRCWRIKLLRTDGGPVNFAGATLRFAAAAVALLPLGAGLAWALFDEHRRALHDRLSGTELWTTPTAG